MKYILPAAACCMLILSAFDVQAQEPVPGLQPAAKPDATVKEILTGLDKVSYGYDDQFMQVPLIIRDVDGKEKKYEMNVTMRGKYQRLIEFTSGESKGMKVLFAAKDEMYIYLPAFKKVRRLAAHNMKEKFMGSDVTNSEMGSILYSEDYEGEIIKQDADFWWVKVTPKTGTLDIFAYRVLKVGKQRYDMAVTEYYEAGKDKPVKIMEMIGEWRNFGGVWRKTLARWTDTATNHQTDTAVNEWKVNKGISESKFSTRNMQWE